MANINLFALGGQDENGKNIFVIEVENDIFIINAGIKFPINDRWGVDGIIADTEYLKKNKNRIKGLFLTHAHDEQFAALPWLIMDIKGLTIYGSQFTIAVAKDRISKYKINHNDYKLEIIKQKNFGNVNVKTFPVATSIVGGLAYNFQTKDGDIIFMSNFINDDLGIFGKTNLQEIKNQSKNILMLISDSRRANYPNAAKEKKTIKRYAEEVFKKTSNKQRIIFGAFDEEMYNIFEIIELANKYNRPVAFYGSVFDSLYRILFKFNQNILRPKQFIDYKKINQETNIVILVTGTWSRLIQRIDRIALDNDVYLKFKSNDAIIMYTPPVNGMEVKYAQSLDKITMITSNILSIDDKMVYPIRQSKLDIQNAVEILKPKFFIPVGSLYRYQKEATKVAIKANVRKDRVIIPPNGRIIYLKDGEIASQKSMIKPFGDVIIQGYGVGDVSFEVIRERKILSSGGTITIAVQYKTKTKQLMGNINVQIIGIVVKSELSKYQTEIKNVVIQKFESLTKFDYREFQNSVRKRVQKIIMKKTGKIPIVFVTLCEI